jgi:leucyl-tRNA synthetase
MVCSTPVVVSSSANFSAENSIDGKIPGPLGVTADQMTDEVWDYILCGGRWSELSPLPRDKADAMKHEFEYFYPFDIRSSGKDLIGNHLTFCAYVHAALFPEEKWPLSMRTNGHLMLNGKKMSKSTGNSLTMREGIEKFGADATRLSLADAGDGVEDANFDEKTANANILRVHTLLQWCEVSMVYSEAAITKFSGFLLTGNDQRRAQSTAWSSNISRQSL